MSSKVTWHFKTMASFKKGTDFPDLAFKSPCTDRLCSFCEPQNRIKFSSWAFVRAKERFSVLVSLGSFWNPEHFVFKMVGEGQRWAAPCLRAAAHWPVLTPPRGAHSHSGLFPGQPCPVFFLEVSTPSSVPAVSLSGSPVEAGEVLTSSGKPTVTSAVFYTDLVLDTSKNESKYFLN